MSRLLILYLGGLTLRLLVFAALGALIAFRVRSVATRHAIWTAVLACGLLMPVADALLPAALVPEQAPEIILPVQAFVPAPVSVEVQSASAIPVVPAPAPRDWWRVALITWMLVVAGLLCRLFVAYRAVHRMKRASLPVSSEVWDDVKVSHRLRFRTPALRESVAVTIPLTVGLWKPVLLLPSDWRDWEPWKLRAVLAHELTHVRRMDWAIAVTASIARSVFWFNPLVWWLERQLSLLAEQASDEACVQATSDAPRYAEVLLQFASAAKNGRRWLGGVAMAQYRISYRIERLLGLRTAGSGVLSKAGWLAVCVLAISILYVSAAAQSLTRPEMPALSPAEIVRVVQQRLPLPEQLVTPVAPPSQPQQPPPPLPTGESAAAQTPVPQDRQSIAMVVVLDRSGSMAGAKMDLAKEATKAPLSLLREKDFFGVLAFDYSFQWTQRIAEVRNKQEMSDRISGIAATGNTNIYPALREAYQQLQAATSETKHIILLSDGQTPAENFKTLAEEMLKNNITVSTIAVTAASDRVLMENIALWGGGRAYYVENPQHIPQIFRTETELATGKPAQ